MGLPAGLRLCGEAVYFAHKPIHRASSVESWYTLTAQYATVVLITRSATCANCVPFALTRSYRHLRFSISFQNLPFVAYFCTENGRNGCTFDRLAKGKCIIDRYAVPPPSAMQYESHTSAGWPRPQQSQNRCDGSKRAVIDSEQAVVFCFVSAVFWVLEVSA
jgi:hypothetical protein